MKTIGYLGKIDKLLGVPVTTRNWNTIVAILRILQGESKKADTIDAIIGPARATGRRRLSAIRK
jgi:hypothetical protein